MIAPDRATALEVRDAILRETRAEAHAAVQMVNSVYPTHEDYIWPVAAASRLSDPDAEPSPSMTTHYSRNQGSEAQVDEVMNEAITPVMEDLVREGKLNGWSWLFHDAGGWFRRSAVFSGSSRAGILDARDELVSRLAGNDAAGLLRTIFSSHVDHSWDPVNSN